MATRKRKYGKVTEERFNHLKELLATYPRKKVQILTEVSDSTLTRINAAQTFAEYKKQLDVERERYLKPQQQEILSKIEQDDRQEAVEPTGGMKDKPDVEIPLTPKIDTITEFNMAEIEQTLQQMSVYLQRITVCFERVAYRKNWLQRLFGL